MKTTTWSLYVLVAAMPLFNCYSQENKPDSTLARKEVKQDGRSITYILAKGRDGLPARPVEAIRPHKAENGDMATLARLEAKAHVMLNVSATVYLTNPVSTELKLRCDGREYTC
jgi:uncharacterized protein YebE (UPF0316 family)